jgi:hypothetical protein
MLTATGARCRIGTIKQIKKRYTNGGDACQISCSIIDAGLAYVYNNTECNEILFLPKNKIDQNIYIKEHTIRKNGL